MEINPHEYPSFFKIYEGEDRNWQKMRQIPPEFVKAHKKDLGERTWVLKAGGKSWNTNIIRRGRDCFIPRSDWVEFVKHHDLHYGDHIMFFLVEKSEFEVLLYSRTTCCQMVPPSNEIIQPSTNAQKHKRKSIAGKYETPKNAKRLAVELKLEKVEEESSDPESEKEEKGVQIRRYNNVVYLDPKNPYFETVVKKSHDTFMTVPMEFARQTRINGEKIIKLKMSGDEIRKAKVIQVVSMEKRVRLANGWTSFKEANGIRTGDKCSFTLVNPGSTEIPCLSVKKLR